MLARRIILIAMLCFNMIIFSGCKTAKQYEYIYRTNTDTVYVSSYKHDSIYLYLKEYMQGDTVYKIEKKNVYLTLVDTLIENHIDTVFTEKVITNEKIQYKNSVFLIVCTVGFFIVILIGIIYLVYKIYKKFS